MNCEQYEKTEQIQDNPREGGGISTAVVHVYMSFRTVTKAVCDGGPYLMYVAHLSPSLLPLKKYIGPALVYFHQAYYAKRAHTRVLKHYSSDNLVYTCIDDIEQ